LSKKELSNVAPASHEAGTETSEKITSETRGICCKKLHGDDIAEMHPPETHICFKEKKELFRICAISKTKANN
jgi:hypothetical protein